MSPEASQITAVSLKAKILSTMHPFLLRGTGIGITSIPDKKAPYHNAVMPQLGHGMLHPKMPCSFGACAVINT